MRKFCFVTTFFIAVSAMPCIADQITYNASIPFQSTTWNNSMSFDQFNPNLGTLTGVSISLTETASGTVQVENLSDAARAVSLNLSVYVGMGGALTADELTSTINLFNQTVNLGAYDGTIDYKGSSGYTDVIAPITKTVGLSSTSQTLFNEVTGTSQIMIPVMAMATTSGQLPGNASTQFRASAGADASITYTYTPTAHGTPEPSSILLLGAGGLGMIAVGRRIRLRPAA